MSVPSLRQRAALAPVSALIAIAVLVATGSLFGLLAPLSVACLHMSGTWSRLVGLAGAAAAALLAAAAGLVTPTCGDLARDVSAVCAVAFVMGIAAAITAGRTDAAKIIEAMPAFAWVADPRGRFTYVSPNTLAYLGAPAEALSPLPESDEFGWRRMVHPDDYDRVIAAWRRCLETGAPYDIEHRLLRHDGAYRWIRNAGSAERGRDGRIVGWHGVTMDIDDRKRAEAALFERERDLSQFVDMAPSHLWRLAPDGAPIFFNRRMSDFLGFDVADLIASGEPRLEALADRVHPDDRTGFLDALGASLRTGEGFALRYRLRRADGVHRWMSSRAEALRDEGGAIVQWYGLCHDTDDQMKADEALRRSEMELQQLIDTVPTQIWCTTQSGRPDYINRAMADYLGLRLEDFDDEGGLPAAIATIVHPDDREPLHAALARSFRTGEPFRLQFRNRRADGVFRWTEGKANPLRDADGRILRWYGANVDIDDLVRARDDVRVRERELSQLVDMVPGFLWRLAPDGEPTYFSRRMAAYFDTPVERFSAKRGGLSASLAAHVHPDDLPRVRQTIARSLAAGAGFSSTHRLRRADGVHRWMSVSAEPLRDDDGVILQWYGICHDIDDQLRIEEALRERERFLWQLVDTLPAMIVCAAPDGEPVYRSEQLRAYLGYGVDAHGQAAGSNLAATLAQAIHPDDLSAVKTHYTHALATGEAYRRKHRLRRHDGVYNWVETRAAPMRDQAGEIVQWNLICLDIEGEVQAQQALRLAQERLARASQAASLAELSASIAHEVNQPLAAVVANSQACHRWLSSSPPNLERAKITAERITRDATAAADVVSRIRSLFTQSTETRNSTSLAGVIAEAHELMAEEAMGRGARFVIDVADDLPPAIIDRVQIQQVLVNLIRNGMDAMDAAASESIMSIAAYRAEDGVRIEVTDQGHGIVAPEKIFEPFFTTKDKGMGMGLAICRSIVESHGGRLWAETREPQGTTFAFTLPAAVSVASA